MQGLYSKFCKEFFVTTNVNKVTSDWKYQNLTESDFDWKKKPLSLFYDP